MGKKGSWFSAIKRVFTHSSKDKVADGTDKKSSKEKKKRFGKSKRDGHSFIPLFREPSSIEQILGEAEREHHIRNHRPPAQPEQSKIPPHVTPFVRNATLLWDDGDDDSLRADTPPRVPSPPREVSPPRNAAQSTPPLPADIHPPPPPPPRRVAPPPQAAPPARAPSPRPVRQWRPEPTLKNQHICATKIQTAYRGYMARRSYRSLRGLVRLQGVVKGQSVKRQTANALRCMQMLVRVQTQIQARRVQMLENQAPQRQGLPKNEKDLETAFGKWMSENQSDWDDSTLTKEEIEARMQKKFDAILKRERAMAYAYSHQSWKSTPRIGHGALADFRTGGYPYWWNWLEKRQPPPPTLSTNVSKSPSMKSFLLTPTRPTMDFKASPFRQSSSTGRPSLRFENMDTSTPKSTRSSIPAMARRAGTPPGRLPPRFSRGSAGNSPFNGGPFRDDDSLTSCPPFSGPRYMSPTASAQAKLKLGKEQFPDSPSSITSDASKRRASFPLGRSPSPGSFKWNKGSLFSTKETSSQRSLGKNQTAESVGNLSIDSSTSMPVSVGRKPFNRFV
ncbi:protein IQ-DOMAIN 13 [Silene latifolia]|uniref:protein IQ-DOMAIN 13 n=1 Tax=Silene latifolia TaxID=37657 RepID=UPI003D7728D9